MNKYQKSLNMPVWVDIRLRKAANRVGDVLRLVVAELQMECVQKVTLVNGLERDGHRVSPFLIKSSLGRHLPI